MKVFSELRVIVLLFICTFLAYAAAVAQVELSIDPAQTDGAIDLPRYSLGQGGLSHEPMFDEHLEEVAALHPRTIRLFVQEYFNLYPDHGVYHWTTLDKSIENILATGARPLMSLCFKPRVLYPVIDPEIVHPNDYAEWEALIEALVRHCNVEKNYGIEYWEVGNEVDQSEMGGCPYLFKPEDYNTYYRHTVEAILRADPAAKVGGPALANYRNPIGDELIRFCGEGNAPLSFFSWHRYSNDASGLRATIREIKQKLAAYPRLAGTETVIDEWNIQLLGNELTTGFQAAFILEGTLAFYEEGLSLSSYYHIRDHFVSPDDFTWMTPGGYKFMADWWNVEIQNSGIYDKQGQRRPSYYVFQMLGRITGQRLKVDGASEDIHAVASLADSTAHLLVWNFPPETGGGQERETVLRFPPGLDGRYTVTRLDAAGNCLVEAGAGELSALNAEPIRLTLAPYGVAWVRLDLRGGK